jgi:hypothetical protein
VIVEHKSRATFEVFSRQIRALATANSGKGPRLALDSGGHATTGPEPILLKVAAFVLWPPQSSTLTL